MENLNENKIDNVMLGYATGVLANGITGSQIIKLCNEYAMDNDVKIPYTVYPFGMKAKRMVLLENIKCFNASIQFEILNDICERIPTNEDVKKVQNKLFDKYGILAKEKQIETELINETKHWLKDYDKSLQLYNKALDMYKIGIYERNILDNMRLSFELLLKQILDNEKSLENQLNLICNKIKENGGYNEICNMLQKIIDYYSKYQNDYVKHNDKVNSKEIEFIIELTSSMMKYIIKMTR